MQVSFGINTAGGLPALVPEADVASVGPPVFRVPETRSAVTDGQNVGLTADRTKQSDRITLTVNVAGHQAPTDFPARPDVFPDQDALGFGPADPDLGKKTPQAGTDAGCLGNTGCEVSK